MARILVVDDEAQVREFLRQALEMDGHEVAAAADGDAGLHAILRDCPDLVVTDIIMPNKGGIVFIKELRAQHPDLPVVAISGGGNTGCFNFLPVARTFPTVWVLKKPFRTAGLLAIVREALSGGGPQEETPAESLAGR
jgi:DNA-binding NtrC family response regulator